MDRIPLQKDIIWYENKNFIDEEFVEIKNSEYFNVEMQYPILGMKTAESRCLLRKEAYERLLQAAKSLPKGMRLKIWDAWRPFALQEELYYVYAHQLVKAYKLENESQETKDRFISMFVSLPIDNRDVPPLHTSGGAVDVTLEDSEGNELDLGSAFDEFSKRALTTFYENEEVDDKVRENRRILYWAMVNAGFTNLPSEWWHFDYGDRAWGYYNNEPAIYRGIFEIGEINTCN